MVKRLFLNDNLVLLLIVVNALVIFANGFELNDIAHQSLLIIDNIITLLFIIELIIKLKEQKNSFFASGWNIFDFIIILLSAPTLLTLVSNVGIFDMSFLLAFRVMRAFKAIRFLKFIPEIGQIINGVRRALKASIVVLIGFIIYLFIISILSFYMFKDSAPDFYSNPLISIYSTFKIFTVEGWFEIPEYVTRNFSSTESFLAVLFYVFVVLTGGIFGLSLVNSIFVDAMVSDNNNELEKKIDSLEKKIDELLTNNTKIR